MAGTSRIASAFPAGRTTGISLSKQALKRIALRAMLACGVVASVLYGYDYWTAGRFLVSTDDAYVQADFTAIAPKVSGYIAQVLVRDNERVKQGQTLARIDDRDFRTALAQARADVATATATIANLDAQITLQHANIAEAQAGIVSADASLKFARQDDARYRRLMAAGAGTVQRTQQAEATLRETTAQLSRSQAAMVAAQKQTAVLGTERQKAVAQRDAAEAVARQARLNLSYTVITAPVSGTVGARTLRVGQFVQAGTQLMAVVPLHAVYITANFKETQLTHIRRGEPVSIEVDGFPSVTLNGHVDSIAPASGLEFALLPPDNATGNFTKIVQRVPVRIAIDDDTLAGRLRAGMSVEPTINTRADSKEY